MTVKDILRFKVAGRSCTRNVILKELGYGMGLEGLSDGIQCVGRKLTVQASWTRPSFANVLHGWT